jgi:hypothetical protein
MWVNPNGKEKVKDAIARLRADIDELEAHITSEGWSSENPFTQKKYIHLDTARRTAIFFRPTQQGRF